LLSALVIALTSTPSTRAQQIEPVPDWLAAAINVDMSVTPAQVRYTVYAGKNGPLPGQATILKWQDVDITSTCVYHGTFGAPDAAGYVAFDGSTTYIDCEAPGIATEWAQLYPTKPLESSLTCNGGAPFFASADVKLGSGTWANPIIAAPSLGVVYSIPRYGAQARSQLGLGSNFSSAPWTPKATGNQLLIGGWNGPGIIAANSQFGWLNYLNSAWVSAFRPITGFTVRHWYQSPNNLTAPVGPTTYMLGTGAHHFQIGHNPIDNSYFKGSLRKASVDPGCPAS
jgi:hypothetical protein